MNSCPKCNAELIITDSGKDHIVKCSCCDYEIAITNSSEMDFDATQYEISVVPGNSVSIDNIKFISKIFGCNFIEAKRILSEGKVLLRGYAIEILPQRDFLKEKNINYKITPDFPY